MPDIKVAEALTSYGKLKSEHIALLLVGVMVGLNWWQSGQAIDRQQQILRDAIQTRNAADLDFNKQFREAMELNSQKDREELGRRLGDIIQALKERPL